MFVGALPAVVLPLLHTLAVAPWGSLAFLWLAGLVLLPCLFAVPMMVVLPCYCLVGRHRAEAARWWAAAIVYVVATWGGIEVGMDVRMAAFREVARLGAPLVRAIRAYEARHGAPPPDLEALMPEYLPTIPTTGMRAYPRFEYHVGTTASHRYGSNPWVLVVFAPVGPNADELLYFPRQNYTESPYAAGVEPMGDWAYHHE